MDRKRLESLLSQCTGTQLLNEFNTVWINQIIPGLDKLSSCDQGTRTHLEGNAALHTALVFDNLLIVAKQRCHRDADFIERLAVLVHDLRKPQTRVVKPDGSVTFPDHERLAALEAPKISQTLNLSTSEAQRLEYMVARHGDANSWVKLAEEVKSEIRASPYLESLALLHEADAISCLLEGGEHLAVYWEEMMDPTRLNSTYNLAPSL